MDEAKKPRVTRRALPPIDAVRALLEYDPQTGIFTWKRRPRDFFKSDAMCENWNRRFSGKRAGAIDGKGYVIVSVCCKNYLLHRLAWLISYGETLPECIDHINGDKSDNRLVNLRKATHSQNKMNSPVRKDNVVTGVLGVHPYRKGFRAQICVDGRRISSPTVPTIAEAAEYRRKFEMMHHGEFAVSLSRQTVQELR